MRRKWLPIGGLLLLSLVWAAGWVRADLFPGAAASGPKLNALQSQAALLAVFTVLAAMTAAIGRKRWPSGLVAGRTLLIGFGLFAVPAALTVLAQDLIDSTTRVALFSLTPLFAAVFEPHIGARHEQVNRSAFPSAMLAVAGTFLVFPFELPQSYAAAGALAGVVAASAAVAAANCAGVEIVQRRAICPLTTGAVAAGSASILLAVAGSIIRGNAVSSAALGPWAVLDVLALASLFWLMGHMNAVQMTTRFLLAPLIANLISLALLRPHVEIQAWIGLLLIAGGSVWMLFAQTDVDPSAPKMLDLK